MRSASPTIDPAATRSGSAPVEEYGSGAGELVITAVVGKPLANPHVTRQFGT